MKERSGQPEPMRPLIRPLMAASAAALLAGCVAQQGGGVVQQAALVDPQPGSSKVDAEVRRIFAVAGLDPNDPQKARAVDRQAVGTVLAVRSGGRKVGMAVARLGRDQIVLQDPEAVARLVPGVDEERLSRALAGPIPTSGSVPGARVSFNRRHLALEVEADGPGAPPAAVASRFVPSMRIGEPVPADVVASVRSGRDLGAAPVVETREDLAAGLPQPTAPAAPSAGPDRSFFASLFQARAPSPAPVPPPAPAPAPAPTAPPPAPPVEAPVLGVHTPPPPSVYASGPAVVTVADDFYGGAATAKAPPANALGYAPPPSISYGAAASADLAPAAPTVRRW